MADPRTGLPSPRTTLFPGQIVVRAKPLGEVVGEVPPFPGIANTPGSRRNRQHGPPVRPAVNRHSKSGPGTIRVTRKIEFDHFGQFRSRLELPLLNHGFDRRGGRWRIFIGRRVPHGRRGCFGCRRIIRLGLWRMASGNARPSEDVLRQRDFMWIAVVVFCHLRVPSICQLRSSTISGAFSLRRSAFRPCLRSSGRLNRA